MRSLSKLTTILSSITLLASVGFAQSNPNVVVEVKDNNGRVITDARVTLVGPEKSEFRTYVGRSDRQGYATFRTNRSGRYVVIATKSDYQVQQRDINVVDGRTTNVEFRMGQNNSEKILVLVRSDDQNQGINGATASVRIDNEGRTQTFSTRSGGFTTIPISSSPSSRYNIQITHPDYDNANSTVRSSDRTDQFVVFNLKRRASDRAVVIRAIDSDSRSPISRAKVTFETNDRDDTRTATTDSNGTVSIRLGRRAVYNVTIESSSYRTVTERIDLQRPDTNTFNRTYELRRGNNNGGGGPINSRGAKLNGDIRFKKGRFKSGEVATADVGVYYTEGQIERMSANVSVKVYGPSGRVAASDDYRQDLDINGTKRKGLDIRTSEAGTYTVRVTASGNGLRTWTADKTFTVDREQAGPEIAEGIYNGTIDLITLVGPSRSHTISMKVSKKNGGLYDVVGNLGPGRFEGFHIQFKGTYDVNRRSLSAVGELVDKTDKRWDIKVTGGLNNAGRMELELSIRALDNSYNRRAKTQMNKN